MARTVLVFGASGTIGQGVLKVSLERNIRAVGVFRSQESAERTRARLGNPPQDKFITVVGTTDTEENAAKIQKQVVDKAKEITDVFAAFGGWKPNGPIFQQSVDDFMQCVGQDKLIPHFLAAKYSLPLIQDKSDTSYTFINGASGLADYPPVPNFGNMAIGAGSQVKLVKVISSELADKPVRINEAVIALLVVPWDAEKPKLDAGFEAASNVEMGKALLGVALNPAAKGLCMKVEAKDLEKLATEGKV